MLYYDEYRKKWYIDYGETGERELYCPRCTDVKDFGPDACQGCGG